MNAVTHVAVDRDTRSQLRSTIFRGLGATVLLHGFSIVLAFAAYRYDFEVSSLPGQISVALAVLCIFSPLVALLVFRNTRRFVVYGWVRLCNLLSAYTLVGITFYYFYFIFAPISTPARTIGLLVGGMLTLYWLGFAYRALRTFIQKSTFVEKAFSASGFAVAAGPRNRPGSGRQCTRCDGKQYEIFARSLGRPDYPKSLDTASCLSRCTVASDRPLRGTPPQNRRSAIRCTGTPESLSRDADGSHREQCVPTSSRSGVSHQLVLRA